MSTTTYSADNQWTQAFSRHEMAYPAEYVIRIFRGNYPHLSMPKPKPGQSILDVGCGDGRHLVFLNSLGLDAHGVEISPNLVEQLRERLAMFGIPGKNINLGSCAKLPYQDNYFDFVMAWNSSYYMSLDNKDYTAHANELLRVLRPGGWLILSVPKETSFIFDGSDETNTPGYRIIRQDPFSVRVGEIMRSFTSAEELQREFSSSCDLFCHGNIHDDCFGLSYHWYLMLARKGKNEVKA